MNTKKTLIILLGLVLVVVVGWLISTVMSKPVVTTSPVGAGVATTSPVGEMYVKDNLLLGLDGKKGERYLIGSAGLPAYTYDKDTDGVSNCTGACIAQWPPYVIRQADLASLANLQSGVMGKVGTTKRADGSLQVTYNGKPLYFHWDDASAGGPVGDSNDGLWHLAKP